MPVRTTFRIDASQVRKDLQQVEQEVAASTKRQATTIAGEGRKAGERQAQEIIKSLRATFSARQGQLKVLRAQKLIDPEEFRRESNKAKEAFNAGIMKAMNELEKRGELTAEAMDRLGRSLQTVGTAGRKSGEDTASGWSKAKTAVGAVFALVAGSRVVRWFGEAVGQAKELGLSFLKLSASAKLFGVSQEQLNRLSQDGVKNYGLSIREANELATTVTKLAARAEQSGKAFEVQARLLDLAAAQGLNATEANLALDQALRGVDEGTDKLFQRNPSDLYREYAAQIGKTAGQLTEVEKKQAILNAVLQEGAKVQGEYGRFLASDIGRLEKWDRLLQSSRETIGSALIPVLADLTDLLAGPLQKATDGFVAFLGGIQLMAVDAALGLQDLKIAGMQVLDTVGKIPGLGFLRPEAGAIGTAMQFRGFMSTGAEDMRRRITAGGFTGASGGGSGGPPSPPPADPGAQAAVDRLRALLREYNLAQTVGLTFLDDAKELPPLLDAARGHLQSMLQLEQKIADLQSQKVHATREQAAELDGIIDALQGQHSAAAVGARLGIARHAGLSGQAALGLVTGGLVGRERGNIFEGAQLRFDPVVQQMQRVRSAVEEVTRAEQELTRTWLEQDTAGQATALAALEAAKAQLRQTVANVMKVLRELIKDEKLLLEIQEKLTAALEGAGITDGDQADRWDDIAANVEGVARGLLATADAMGILNDRTRRTLQGVVDLASGFRMLGTNTLGGAFQIAGGAIGILGGLFGGGGEPEHVRELREALEANREALQRNTQALRGELAASDPTVGRARSAIAATEDRQRQAEEWRRMGVHIPFDYATALAEELAKFGLTMADLEALAQQAGIDLGAGPAGFAALGEWLTRISTGDIASSFAGAIKLLREEFELLNVTDPAEKVRRFREAVLEFITGDLATQFAGVDWSDPEQVEAFTSALFAAIRDGTFALEDLGTLSLDEFLSFIKEFKRLGEEAVGGGFSKSVQIARTITEVQAVEVIAWLNEIALTGHDQLAELRGIHALLGQGFASSVPAAAASVAGFTGAGGFVVNGPITVAPQLTERDFQSIWQRLGEEIWLRRQGRGL